MECSLRQAQHQFRQGSSSSGPVAQRPEAQGLSDTDRREISQTRISFNFRRLDPTNNNWFLDVPSGIHRVLEGLIAYPSKPVNGDGGMDDGRQ